MKAAEAIETASRSRIALYTRSEPTTDPSRLEVVDRREQERDDREVQALVDEGRHLAPAPEFEQQEARHREEDRDGDLRREVPQRQRERGPAEVEQGQQDCRLRVDLGRLV